MKTKKLSELAGTIRSKNAGVNQVIFDIIFRDKETYEKVRKTQVLTEGLARFFDIPLQRISDFVEFDPGNAIKFTLYRSLPCGSLGDWDILGCQQYGPLLDLLRPAIDTSALRASDPDRVFEEPFLLIRWLVSGWSVYADVAKAALRLRLLRQRGLSQLLSARRASLLSGTVFQERE